MRYVFEIHAHKRKRFSHPFVNFFLRQFEVFRAESHVVVHRVGKQLIFRILEHHAHGAPQLFVINLFLRQVYAVDNQRAALQFYQPVEMLHESAFAAARVSDYGEKLAFFHRQADVDEGVFFKSRFGVVDKVQVFDND